MGYLAKVPTSTAKSKQMKTAPVRQKTCALFSSMKRKATRMNLVEATAMIASGIQRIPPAPSLLKRAPTKVNVIMTINVIRSDRSMFRR